MLSQNDVIWRRRLCGWSLSDVICIGVVYVILGLARILTPRVGGPRWSVVGEFAGTLFDD